MKEYFRNTAKSIVEVDDFNEDIGSIGFSYQNNDFILRRKY